MFSRLSFNFQSNINYLNRKLLFCKMQSQHNFVKGHLQTIDSGDFIFWPHVRSTNFIRSKVHNQSGDLSILSFSHICIHPQSIHYCTVHLSIDDCNSMFLTWACSRPSLPSLLEDSSCRGPRHHSGWMDINYLHGITETIFTCHSEQSCLDPRSKVRHRSCFCDRSSAPRSR